MQTLKRYAVSYQIQGEPDTLMLEDYSPPTLDQVRLQLLLKHLDEPQVVEDAPWEENVRPALESRGQELGISDIHIQEVQTPS